MPKFTSFCYFIGICLSTILSWPNQLLAQNKAILEGNIADFASQTVTFQYYATPFQNNLDQLEIPIDAKGNFKIQVPLLEHQVSNLILGQEIVRFHLSPGDSVFLNLVWKEKKKVQTFTGKGSKESGWFEKQRTQFESTLESNEYPNQLLKEMGYRSPENFKKYLDSIVVVKLAFLKKNSKDLSPAFVNWQSAEIIYEQETYKLNYPVWYYSMRGIENKIKEVDSNYYSFLNNQNINKPEYLNANQYRNFLKYYFLFELKRQNQPFDVMNLYAFSAKFFSGEVLNTFRLHLWSDFIQYGQINDAKTLYPFISNLPVNKDAFKYLEFKYKEKLPFAPGAAAFPFTLKNTEGKLVSLSDFKGKVVYIDFWASWCGPCKREFPAGEELKKYYSGKEVVFLNISIDEDEVKWRQAIASFNLSGIQLISNSVNNPEVLNSYRIASIPVYYLIGKDGNFLAAPAARPSNSGIYQQINEALLK